MATLNDQDRQAIENSIFAGRKIEAIKLYRTSTSADLAEAKKAVEDMEVDLRSRCPENFRANKVGCTGVLICTTLLIIGVVSGSLYIFPS